MTDKRSYRIGAGKPNGSFTGCLITVCAHGTFWACIISGIAVWWGTLAH